MNNIQKELEKRGYKLKVDALYSAAVVEDLNWLLTAHKTAGIEYVNSWLDNIIKSGIVEKDVS